MEKLYTFRHPLLFTYMMFLLVANFFGYSFVFENPELLYSLPFEIVFYFLFHLVFGFLLFRDRVFQAPILILINFFTILRAGFRLYSVHLAESVTAYFEITEHLLFFLCLSCFVMFLKSGGKEEIRQ